MLFVFYTGGSCSQGVQDTPFPNIVFLPLVGTGLRDPGYPGPHRGATSFNTAFIQCKLIYQNLGLP